MILYNGPLSLSLTSFPLPSIFSSFLSSFCHFLISVFISFFFIFYCECQCHFDLAFITIVEKRRDARRDKKAFLSDQCKEIEKNNRMGKTRDLFKEIRDTKGTFHPKMGSIKDRNGMYLAEEEDINKR